MWWRKIQQYNTINQIPFDSNGKTIPIVVF